MTARRWLTTMAALLVVLALVIAGVAVLATRKHGHDDLVAQRESVVSSATNVATKLSSLGSEHDQAQLDAIKELSTGQFRNSIVGQAPLLHEVFKIGNVRSAGTVTAVGIERMDADTATTLITLQTQVSDAKVPGGEVRKYRMEIVLRREGDRWLASEAGSVA